MKPLHSPDEQSRFRGPLRHYHRSGTKQQKTWDEWVNGAPSKTGSSGRLWKITGVVVAASALVAIVAGLIIELR